MRRLVLGIAAAAWLAAPAHAGLIRYDFSGSLTTSDTTSSFAPEAGFVGGVGSYNGYAVFDSETDEDPGPSEAYTSQDFLLQIGGYSFSAANAGFDFAFAVVDPAAPQFRLDFQSGSDFSPSNSFDFLQFSIAFPGAVAGLLQSPVLADGAASLNLVGDSQLFAEGDVTQFDVMATSVPEPASWIMLIGGFGLVGARLRMRQRRPMHVM